jgi:hypothetical protein
MLTIERQINNPGDFAYIVFKAAESEIDDVVKENERRAERLKKPLPMPRWNVKEMLENLNNLTEQKFANPHFQRYAFEHPWDGKSSKKDWTEIATETLRDYYLLPIAHDDADLFQQMCKIWSDLTPEPTLTKEQRAELAKLQLQADNIIARGEELVSEFMKLAEQERKIIIGTQSKWNTLIANQVRYLKGNMSSYHERYVAKW